MDRLSELAAQWGVDRDYVDAFGKPQSVAPEALSRIVTALAGDRAPLARALPSTFVVRQGRDPRLALPAEFSGAGWRVVQDGDVLAQGRADAGTMALPAGLPVGSFRLVLSGDGGGQEAVLLVAPERAYQGEPSAPERTWAIAVQLYGIRSARNWGHGDFTDLGGLVELAAALGAAGIALNPIHALFDDRPEQASPYAPNSRLFLNSLYIDVAAIPEFPGATEAGLQPEIDRLRLRDTVDYAGVAAVKQAGLRLAYARFCTDGSPARRAQFEAFRAERGPLLARFAAFELLRRRYPQVWWDWPEPWRRPGIADLARLRDEEGAALGFYEFVQFVADAQLRDCADRARRLGLPIGLYLDLAVGVDAGGADAWSEPDAVLNRLSVGAPPDVMNTGGQNWGLAGFNPVGLEADEFRPFRHMLQAAMRHAGAIRIDHVLGLKRLFLIPHGTRPHDGAYVRLPFEAMLAVLAQESVQNRSIVIGEDLGTVPPDFRGTLADWGIWSYLVLMFEREHDGSFRPPEHFARSALVTFNTHDLPTFAGWTSGHDLAVRRGLGIDPGESDEDRARAVGALRRAIGVHGDGPPPFDAVVRYLARTGTRLLVVSMEDALGVVEQPNLPGTVDEHPNWRRRLPVDLHDLAHHDGLRRVAEAAAAEGRDVRTAAGTTRAHG